MFWWHFGVSAGLAACHQQPKFTHPKRFYRMDPLVFHFVAKFGVSDQQESADLISRRLWCRLSLSGNWVEKKQPDRTAASESRKRKSTLAQINPFQTRGKAESWKNNNRPASDNILDHYGRNAEALVAQMVMCPELRFLAELLLSWQEFDSQSWHEVVKKTVA